MNNNTSSTARFKHQLTVGVLDSGVGGLSVLRSLVEATPALVPEISTRFVYLADTLRFPYGERQPEQIQEFTAELISWLAAKSCDVVVAACHTVATTARLAVFEKSPVPVYDLSAMGSWLAIPNHQTIIVLATPATASIALITKSLVQSQPGNKIIEIGCPELAPLIESGADNIYQLPAVLDKYVNQVMSAQATTVILGCTHYPFISDVLAKMLPRGIAIIDPAVQFADYLFGELGFKSVNERRVISKEQTNNEIQFYVSGSPSDFERKLILYTPELHGPVAPVSIEELEAAREKFMPPELELAQGF